MWQLDLNVRSCVALCPVLLLDTSLETNTETTRVKSLKFNFQCDDAKLTTLQLSAHFPEVTWLEETGSEEEHRPADGPITAWETSLLSLFLMRIFESSVPSSWLISIEQDVLLSLPVGVWTLNPDDINDDSSLIKPQTWLTSKQVQKRRGSITQNQPLKTCNLGTNSVKRRMFILDFVQLENKEK